MIDNQIIMFNEAEYILHNLSELLPNLEKMIAVYYDHNKKGIAAIIKEKHGNSPAPLEFDTDFDFYGLERMRQNGNKTYWTDEKNLPFNHTVNNVTQLEVFHEADNSVLTIAIKNQYDKNNDLYFLYFNKDATNFGPVRNDKILNTVSKNVIENMIYNAVLAARKQRENTLKDYKKYKTYLGRLRDKAKTQSAYLAAKNKELNAHKLDFANYIIRKLSGNNIKDISFSPEAEKLIASFTGDFASMELWIKEAFEFAYFSDFSSSYPMLIVEDWHFGEQEMNLKEKETKEEPIDGRYYKTYALLNKLETAATKVIAARQKLTGSAVGQAMEQPISAPAISDALKKHSKKIISLMEKYPGKWTLIRNEFKPVVNVLESGKNKFSQTA